MFWYVDRYYFLLIVPAMLIAMFAQARVNTTFNRYSRVYSRRGITAAQVARSILDANGLYEVQVMRVSGHLTDHYDPRTNVVRLSDSVYTSSSIASIGVAAHEVGHAIQHATDYAPLTIRSAIIPITNLGSQLSMPLILLGILFLGTAAGGNRDPGLFADGSVPAGNAACGIQCKQPRHPNAGGRRVSGSGGALRRQAGAGGRCHDLCGGADHLLGTAVPSDPAVRPAGRGLI